MTLRTSAEPAKAKMAPEIELVLCCASGKIDEAHTRRILELLRLELNWPEIFAIAIEQQIVPLVFEALRFHDAGLTPPDWMEAFQSRARSIASRNMLLFVEMSKISQALRAGGISFASYKGPTLAWLSYRNLARRTYENIDFCLEEKEVSRARTILETLGLELRRDAIEGADGLGPPPGQYIFFSNPKRLVVKLHTERTFWDLPGRISLTDLNQRLQIVEIGGQKIPTFSLEDSLILSCVQGTRTFWNQFSWLADVAGILSANAVDWKRAMKLAETMKCRRALLLGACLAHELSGVYVQEEVLGAAAREPEVRWLLRKQKRHLSGQSGTEIAGTVQLLFSFKSQDGWREGFRNLSRMINATNESGARTQVDAGRSSALCVPSKLWRQFHKYRNFLLRPPKLDLAGFLPMRPDVVDHLLEFAGIKESDVLYDLGCGDGRIVVAAAEKFGIRAVGVDLNPRRISEARINARNHGVQGRVRFLQADAKSVDISEATVITLYVGMNGMLRLAPSLKERLRPGVRIVSCDAQIYAWPCDEETVHKSSDGPFATLYLWRVGATPPSGEDQETSAQPAAQGN